MMEIGSVGMHVHQGFVPMQMRMGFAEWVGWPVRVPMVRIVNMQMRVIERVMDVDVFVPFGEVQPDSRRHQTGGRPKQNGWNLAEEDQRENHPDEWRQRKIRAGARRPQMAQGENEGGKTQAIAQKAEEGRPHPGDRKGGRLKYLPECEIHRSGDETLPHGDLSGVGR